MNRIIRQRNREALVDRIECDGVASMEPTQWGLWVDALPLGEFMALIDLFAKGRTDNGEEFLCARRRRQHGMAGEG